MALDKEPLLRLLVRVSNTSDPPEWSEGMLTLDSGASINVISCNFAKLANIDVDKVDDSLQLFNASGKQMTVDGVIHPLITLTNGQQTRLGVVIVSPDLIEEQFLLSTNDMVHLKLLPDSKPFHGLHNIGNKFWKPICVNKSTVSYFQSVKKINHISSCELM